MYQALKHYRQRIVKPVDVIKQPWLDLQRALLRGVYYLLHTRIKSRPYPESVDKILLVRRNRLGDAVNSTPLIVGLRQSYPQLRIHVLANPYNRVVFEHTPGVDCVHVIDEYWGLGKFSLFCHPLLQALRREQFDLVIGLGGYSSVLAQLVYWVKGRYNVGMASKKGGLYDLLYDLGLPDSGRGNGHHVDDMAAIIRAAGLSLPQQLPYTTLSRPHQPQGRWLALCPDVKRNASRYPLQSYARLVETVLQRGWVDRVCLFTDKPDSPYRQLEQSGAQWCATASVQEFMDQVSRCRWAVSAEGGGAHIIGALGLDLLVLSGMGHQQYWRPYVEHVRVIDHAEGIASVPVEDILQVLGELIQFQS
jgi:ADP-heptose:LPS heptosyltransferase